jgi:hypothetical protein
MVVLAVLSIDTAVFKRLRILTIGHPGLGRYANLANPPYLTASAIHPAPDRAFLNATR